MSSEPKRHKVHSQLRSVEFLLSWLEHLFSRHFLAKKKYELRSELLLPWYLHFIYTKNNVRLNRYEKACHFEGEYSALLLYYVWATKIGSWKHCAFMYTTLDISKINPRSRVLLRKKNLQRTTRTRRFSGRTLASPDPRQSRIFWSYNVCAQVMFSDS